jgi:hypothetical protein
LAGKASKVCSSNVILLIVKEARRKISGDFRQISGLATLDKVKSRE